MPSCQLPKHTWPEDINIYICGTRGSVQFSPLRKCSQRVSDHWIRLTWCAHGIKSNQIKLYGEQGAQTMHQWWFNISVSVIVQSPRIIIIPYVVFLATNLLSGARPDDKENRENLLMYHVLSKRLKKNQTGPWWTMMRSVEICCGWIPAWGKKPVY